VRAIGYFNLSVSDQSFLDSTEVKFNEYCKLNMHRPMETFVSVGEELGWTSPEFQSLIEYIDRSGGGFLVVIPESSHIASDLENVARAVIRLEKLDCRLICWDEEFPDPIQNAFQTLGVKGVSRTRSRRIREAMRARVSEGKAMGRPPYGYRIGSQGVLEVNSAEASVVELIYRLYTKDKLGFRLIAQHLNERGITTKRKGNWAVIAVRDTLRNHVYTGTYSRLGMRKAKIHEAIIPSETFRLAQDIVKSRRPIGRIAKYEPFLLKGLLYCAYCDNKMIGVTRRQSWKGKDGRRTSRSYRYYQCQSRNNLSTCGYHTWRTTKLEAAVLDRVKYIIQNNNYDPDKEMHLDSTGDNESITDEQRVVNAERQFIQSLKRVARGDVRVTILSEYLKELDASREMHINRGAYDSIGSTLQLDNWESLDFDSKRKFLFGHIGRINVQDDSINIIV
jgi:site-specific DNA recombinase